jgi:Uma2 family endonuclease
LSIGVAFRRLLVMKPLQHERLTAEEYGRLPGGNGREELIAGFVVSEPQPLFRHGRIQARLAGLLDAYVQSRGLGAVAVSAGFLLAEGPDTVRGPDVAFVQRHRFDAHDEARGFFRGAPDLAVEILSPSNRAGEIHAKVADYLAAGSKLVWVLDTERRRASVYRTLLAPRRIPEEGVLEGEDVIPGFSVTVSELLNL